MMSKSSVVTSRPSGLGWVFVWVILGVAALVPAAITQNVHLAVLAILPFVLAFAAWFAIEPPVRFEVTKEGLSFETPETVFVRYGDIEGLTSHNASRDHQFAMQVYHPDGVVRIPASIDIPSWDLREYLVERMPHGSAPDPDDVPGALRGFVAEQVAKFGAEKVYVHRARRHPPARTHARTVAYLLGFAVAGILWAVAGGVLGNVLDKKAADPAKGWLIGGIVLSIPAFLLALLFSRQHRSGRVKNWRESCIVISPGGIALAQGSLKGKMRWGELRAVEYPARPRFGLTAAGAARGIGLLVEGAYLIIADYYDRPLFLIYEQIDGYWGGREAN
jgi:hypothetical protein